MLKVKKRMPFHLSTRNALIVVVCLISLPGVTPSLRACDPDPDPQGLAGPHVVFMNNCTEGTSIVASNAYTREQAMNPNTPLRDPFGLRLHDRDSKLKGSTTSDPVGDTLYIRGGVYEMPLISVFNRVVFWQENDIKIKAYPGERVTIRGSTFLPGGLPPNTFCYPIPAQGMCTLNHMFQFWFCDDVIVEGIAFVGNTSETITVAGQPVTGNLFAPYMLRFWECDQLTLRDLSITDFTSVSDIGLGLRYLDNPSYMHTEHMARGLTVSYSTGLEMDRVSIDGSPDDPSTLDLTLVPWDIAGFITESLLGTATQPIHVRDCSFRDCAGNAVEFSTVTHPQRFIIFEGNQINNWKNGIQIGGSGPSENMIIRNNRITYNHHPLAMWGAGGYGIKLSSSANITLANNVIFNGGLDGCAIELVAGQAAPSGLFSTISNTDILHNTLYRSGSQAISIYNKPNLDGSLPLNRITGTRVINNLIYQINPAYAQSSNVNNPHRELYLQFPHFEENGGYGNVFRNNLFVPARSDGKSIGSANFGHWLLNGGLSGSWQCYINPEMSGCSWVTCAPSSGCDIPTRYKYDGTSFNSLQPYAQDNIHATSAMPMFVNASKNNFHLVSGSPAINQATPLPEVATDFDGVVRSLAGGCTIGAYEFDPPVAGDLTCDYQVNLADVSAMVLALVSPATYAQNFACSQNGDINQDQKVDGRDVRGFVDIVTP